MANILYDLIDLAELTGYVRAYDNEVLFNEFALQQYLPNQFVEDIEFKVRKGGFKDVETAEYRPWDTPAPMTGRQGISFMRGEIAPLSRQIALGEEEMLRLRQLQSGSDTDLVNAIYDDATRMIRSVQARVELARGQLLTTGKVTLNENGLQLEADFGMKSTHLPVAAASWAVNTTDILTDLLTWQELYVDDTGVEPGGILMSRKILGYMINNQTMREAASFGGIVPGRINAEAVDAILAGHGLPPVTLYDTRVRVGGGNNSPGTSTRVIPDDKLLFTPPAGETVGSTLYGITAEAIKLAAKGMIVQSDMPGVVAVVTGNDHPVQTFTVGTAVALPVMPAPDLIICADVVP
jgi:hypothetical protein